MVGIIGSMLTLISLPLFDEMRIDDPVGMLNGVIDNKKLERQGFSLMVIHMKR